MTAHTGRTSPHRPIPRALAALSACCLTVLTAGPAGASASSSVINAGLNGVSCTAADNCMAVGTFLGSIQGTSASCTGASSCMAVGDFTGTGNEMTLRRRGTGRPGAWSRPRAHSLEACSDFQTPATHGPRRSSRPDPAC